MVPYTGRFALRVVRIVLAFMCLAWYPFIPGSRVSSSLLFLIAYAIFSVGTLFETKFDAPPRANLAFVIDIAFFLFAKFVYGAEWAAPLIYGYLLTTAVLLQPVLRVVFVALAGTIVMALPRPSIPVVWIAIATGGIAIAFAFYKGYLEQRMSNTLRYNVVVRSQAERARETERERIAADFHDGPLQNFISFQMRLEILRKLLARDVNSAVEELHQLQDLCRNQVTELRGFVRSMRPVDEGVSLSASLSRMSEQFQRDTGISTTFSSAEFNDPAATEVSLELLQIIRETFANIHKHSGASRVALSIVKHGERLEVRAEDNGGGFPFSGSFTLEELEMMGMGPISIKRRVRMLGGDLVLESRPGHGSCLEIRVPV